MPRKLGNISVGSIVKINEIKNGVVTPVEYLIVHQGKPSDKYDDSCNGTWVYRKDIHSKGPYRDDGLYNNYDSSNIHRRLQDEFFHVIADLQSVIKQVRIPYFRGSTTSGYGSVAEGSNGLRCTLFLLSTSELAYGKSYQIDSDFPAIGSVLQYFKGCDPTFDKKRASSYEGYQGVDLRYWIRTPKFYSGRGDTAYAIDSRGNGAGASRVDIIDGIRWAFILPQDLIVDDNNIVTDKTNIAPSAPANIAVPETIRGGEDSPISWSAASDIDGNLDGYIVERSYNGGSSWAQIYQGRETSTTTTIPFGTETVMFRVQAYDTYGEKSGWRTSENKTVINNRAPAAPPSISVPLSPAGGDKLTITWTASTDADGNLEGYELERQWDGVGAFTQIYKGAALSFQDSIPKGTHSSVVYRVRAYDSFASYSSYTTSPSRTIDNNTAPVISCDLSGDLGEKSEGFSVPYTVSDAEQQEVTVAEKVGDLVKRTYTATLDQQNTFDVTGEYFQKILNGAQTVQIVATDSAGKSSTLSLTFTKVVHKAVITLSEPLAVEEQITVAVLAITGKIPADATQLVELTNNGNDPEPVWEDATADVKAGRNYVFKNKSQSAGWAFNFRVTVERGESGEDGNIVSIQGGFQ